MGPAYIGRGVVAVGTAFVVERYEVVGFHVCGPSILFRVKEEVGAHNFWNIFSYIDIMYRRYVWASGVVFYYDEV